MLFCAILPIRLLGLGLQSVRDHLLKVLVLALGPLMFLVNRASFALAFEHIRKGYSLTSSLLFTLHFLVFIFFCYLLYVEKSDYWALFAADALLTYDLI